MPQFTQQTFAQEIRRRVPQATGTDQELVERWMASHPQDRNLILEDTQGPGLLSKAAIAATRIVPPIAGAIAGIPGGPLGIAAGGAAGGGIGEGLAQTIEQFLGQREDFNPKAIGVNAGLGAIPVGRLAQGSRAARVGIEALKGAGIGGGSSAAIQLAEQGSVDPKNVLLGAGLGTVLGGGAAGFATRAGRQVAAPTKTGNVRLDKVNQERVDLLNSRNQITDDLDTVSSNLIKKFSDRRTIPRSFVERLASNEGKTLTADIDPGAISDKQLGGVMGLIEDAGQKMDDIVFRHRQQDLDTDAVNYLTLKSFEKGAATLKGKAIAAADEAALLKKQIQEAIINGKPGRIIALTTKRKKAIKTSRDIIRKLESGEALPAGFTPKSVTEELAAFESQLGSDRLVQIKAAADDVFRFNRESLDIIKDARLIDEKVYGELTSASEIGDHVPLLRFMDALDSQLARKRKGRVPALAALEGSKRLTLDPYSASLSRRQSALLAAAENKAKLGYVKFRKLNENFADALPEVRDTSKIAQGMDTFSVVVDGKKKTFAAPSAVAASINQLDEEGTSLMGEFGINFFTRLTSRAATALNLGFSFTNVPRDVADVFLLRGVVKNPVQAAGFAFEWSKVLAQVLRREGKLATRKFASALPKKLGQKFGDLPLPEVAGRKEFIQEGAAFSGLQKQISPGQFIRGAGKGDAGIGEKVLGGLDTVLAPIARLSSSLEDTTKIASFNMLTKRGITGATRTDITRRLGGSPDFAVRGTKSRTAGNAILFFNAQMQGIVRNYRAMKDYAKAPKAMAKLATGALGIELVRNNHNAKFTDSDGTQTIDRITNSDRENYWTWVLEDTETVNGIERHKIAKLSKGHLARIIFNPLADVLRANNSETEEFSPTQTTLNLAEQFLPGSINIETDRVIGSFLDGMASSATPLIKTPIELLANRNTFSKIPLESQANLRLPPSQRTTVRTSPAISGATRRLAEETGLEVSPIQAQHVLRNIFPGPGEQAVEFADRLKAGESIPRALGGATFEPLARRFRGSPGNKVQRDQNNRFFKALKKSQQVNAQLRKMQVEEPTKAQGFLNKNVKQIQVRRMLEKVSTQLAKLRQLPPEQGEAMIRQLLTQTMTVLDEAGIDK